MWSLPGENLKSGFADARLWRCVASQMSLPETMSIQTLDNLISVAGHRNAHLDLIRSKSSVWQICNFGNRFCIDERSGCWPVAALGVSPSWA
jgi:hypothetical protein